MSSSSRARTRAKREATSWKDRVQDHLPHPVRRIVEEARTNDVFLLATSLAFYALISIAPLSVVVLWVVGLIVGERRLLAFAAEAGRASPKNLGLDRIVRQVAQAGGQAGVIGIVTGLWPATSYGAGLQRAFDRLGDRPGQELHGLRGRGLFSVLLIPVFVVGGLVASYAGTRVLGSGGLGFGLGLGLSLVIGFATAALGLVIIYRVFPPTRLAWPSIWRAVLWTATVDAILLVAFVAYLSTGTDFQQHYVTSGVAFLVLFAVWLFLSNVMLLVGFRIGLDAQRNGR